VVDPPGPFDSEGMSNSWVVSGEHTTTGSPVLCNDPHLAHRMPSTMYLAHVVTPEVDVIGATLPGAPGVIIGSTPHFAWGFTTPYVDTQDLVRLELAPDKPSAYVMDGHLEPFTRKTQRFVAGGEVVHEEVWRGTRFGPVLPSIYDDKIEPGETYALLWTGFDAEASPDQLTAFWELSKAKNVDAAAAALDRQSAVQNVVLAFADGTIAYRLMGKVPRRRSSSPTDLPRDGRSADGGWSGFLTGRDKPQLTNPSSGFIVTANQRVVERGHAAAGDVGGYGATPHRAQRIHERLNALLADGRKASPQELLAIQQDVVSVEARALAPVIGAACEQSAPADPLSAELCRRVRAFDGSFSIESDGALAFVALLEALALEILATHLGADVAEQLLGSSAVRMAIEDGILGEANGEPSPLLDDRGSKQREGLVGFVARALPAALKQVIEKGGRNPEGWRWGKVHTISFRSPLASAPVIGGLFATKPQPTAGWSRTVRAEGGLPVRTGAVLRILGQPGRTPRVRLVGDLGNSGHRGSEHAEDMFAAWQAGEPLTLPLSAEEIDARATGRIVLEPR
jgi:penicillin amidase